jgi:hypothetical protein
LIELGAAASEIGLGRLTAARTRLRAFSGDVDRSRNPELFAGYIRVAALLTAREENAETASRLFATVDRFVRETGYADLALPPDRAALDRVRTDLGEEAFERSQRHGASLTDAEVLALAASVIDAPR